MDEHTAITMSVLGRVSAVGHGAELDLQPGQRQLLSLLVAVGDGGATVDWLADEIWGERLPKGWKPALRMAVSRLRNRLGVPVTSINGRYRLAVDRSRVDAWHLLDLLADHPGWHPSMAAYLSCGPFTDAEPSPALLVAGTALTRAQRQAIDRLSRAPEPVPHSLLTRLADHLAQDPTNEDLCRAVALCHARSGETGVAVELIEQCRAAVRDQLDRALGPETERLLTELPLGSRAPRPGLSPSADPVPIPLPTLRRRPVPPIIGRNAELDRLRAALTPDHTGVVVVRGAPASGKTTVLDQITAWADDAGMAVIRIAGSPGERVGLAPLSNAVPAYRSWVLDEVHQLDDPLIRKGMLSARFLHLLEAGAEGRRLLLVIDDAHWLDSLSCDVVEYLTHSAAAGALTLVLAARTGVAAGPGRWADLAASIDHLPGTVSLSLGPLDETALAALIAVRRPGLELAARAQLARALRHDSSGLPGVAIALLEAESTPSTPLEINQIYDRLLEPLDPETRDVGAAAAVLGTTFLLNQLALLLARSEAALETPLSELIRRDLMAETAVVGEFRFSHQLVAEAFLRSALATRRARLHFSASRLAASPHELARHQRLAGALVEPAVARASLVASARRHLVDGAFWESVTAFRQALSLDAGDLDAGVMVDYATALSLSGQRARATTVRNRAHDLAVTDDRWDLAHDAAVSGLPTAEFEEGEPDRLARLLEIPPCKLDPARQVSQALHLSRMTIQDGDVDAALAWSDQAMVLAQSDDDRAAAALARWFVDGQITPPAQRLAQVGAALTDLDLSPIWSCRVHQVRAIDHFELGRLDLARVDNAQFLDLARQNHDPLRQWHGLLFSSMVAETDGDWTRADAFSAEALDLGRRHGIMAAGIVALAQGYFRFRLLGQLAVLASAIDDIPESDGSLLFASARATVLDAAGRGAEAAAEATRVAQAVIEDPSPRALDCLALLAPILGRRSGPGLVAAARSVLGPLAEGALMVGAGIGNLGPVAPLAAALDQPTGRAREQQLRRAIALADRFTMRSWGVRYRVDLAVATGSRQALDEAESLADGTSLVALLPAPGAAVI